MTAKEIMSKNILPDVNEQASPFVDADTHIVDTLHALLDSDTQRLDVVDGGMRLGCITPQSLIQGLGNFLARRDDCSYIVLECPPEDYSASLIAHAVEDADAHLVDLWTSPADGEKIRVSLRVRRDDPTAVVRSLERYGFSVTDTYSRSASAQYDLASERFEAIRALLNV